MDYSRVFDPETDQLIHSGSQLDPCVTNFFKGPVATFISNHQSSDYFEVESVNLSGQVHFQLKAHPDGGQTPVHIGEMPCPEHCLPDQPLIQFNKFDRDHLSDILSNSPVHIQFLCIHRCRINGTTDSFAAYGHTGTQALTDVDRGHKVYVSVS